MAKTQSATVIIGASSQQKHAHVHAHAKHSPSNSSTSLPGAAALRAWHAISPNDSDEKRFADDNVAERMRADERWKLCQMALRHQR